MLHELPPRIETEDWVQLVGDGPRRATATPSSRATSWRCAGPPTRRDASRVGEARPAHRDRRGGDGQRPQGRRLLVLPRRARHRDRSTRSALRIGPITGSVPPAKRQQLVDDSRSARQPARARQPDRGRRRRAEHPGGVGRDPVRAAVEADDRGAGDRPLPPDGPGAPGRGAPPARGGQRRPADARDPGAASRRSSTSTCGGAT